MIEKTALKKVEDVEYGIGCDIVCDIEARMVDILMEQCGLDAYNATLTTLKIIDKVCATFSARLPELMERCNG